MKLHRLGRQGWRRVAKRWVTCIGGPAGWIRGTLFDSRKSGRPALADQLMKGGLDIVTGGTDTHVMLVDLRPKSVKGNVADAALGRAHITCNKNGVPFDPEKPTVTSGLRLGSPAGTTRGFKEAEFRQIADWIVEVTDGLAANGEDGNDAVENKVRGEVEAMCARSPIYPGL